MNEIVDLILERIEWYNPPTLKIGGLCIEIEDIIIASLPNNTTKEIANILGCSYTALNAQLYRNYRSVFIDKTPKILWADYFLSLIEFKCCKKCLLVKQLHEYNNCTGKFLDKKTECRDCSSNLNKLYYLDNKEKINTRHSQHYFSNKAQYIEKAARRRASKKLATPKWADLDKIKEIYLNCPKGFHVDHIIPLNNPLVCGLHVHNNLEAIPALDNLSKGNTFEIT